MLYCGMHAVEGQLDSRRQGWPMQVFCAHLQLKVPGLGPDPVPRSYPGCPGPMFLLWVRHRTVSLEDWSCLCPLTLTLCDSPLALPVPRRCLQPRIQTPKPTQMGPRRSLWLQHGHPHPPPRPLHLPPPTQMYLSKNPLEAESQVRPEPPSMQPCEAMERKSPLIFRSREATPQASRAETKARTATFHVQQ